MEKAKAVSFGGHVSGVAPSPGGEKFDMVLIIPRLWDQPPDGLKSWLDGHCGSLPAQEIL